jgi:CubicO group peptidase (beta-lactamase class C family)
VRNTYFGLALVPLVASLAIAPCATAAPVVELSSASIDAYAAKALDGTALPGMSIVVTHGGTVVHAAGYGHDSAGRPVTADTSMRVASVSKSFTAMAVMTLVDAGKIALDEPVARQLPEFRPADGRAAAITVRQLLNQTSGLADGGVDLGAADSATNLAGYVAALRTGALTAAPGTRWAYSNVNYEVAARLVEVAGGVSFGDYLAQHVFGPLGMTGSAVGDGVIKPAEGYNSVFGRWMSRPELDDFSTRGGAGGIITNAADMGRWLMSQTGNGVQLVRPESLATMHTSSAIADYGMGWGPVTVNGTELLVHSGNLFTYNAVEAIDPATGYGFAVMTNGAGMYDDTYDIMTGLVALSQGRTAPVPGGSRQLIELVLGLVGLAAVGLAVLGVLRSRRWADRRSGRPAWRIGLRLAPALVPPLLLIFYPQLISLLMNGRTVTWTQLSIVVATAALAGAVVTIVRLLRLRSVTSAR